MKMCFVGREKEVRKLTKALEGGRHVIVTGPYGIGRTRMIRQIAETGRRERRFVFVMPTAGLCRVRDSCMLISCFEVVADAA